MSGGAEILYGSSTPAAPSSLIEQSAKETSPTAAQTLYSSSTPSLGNDKGAMPVTPQAPRENDVRVSEPPAEQPRASVY
ncbi:MAG: hypothetical protein ACYC9L_16285, partial [Sulfuricaulis sp.]